MDKGELSLKADIKFGNGSIQHCVGRVRGGVCAPWNDEEDLRSHIAHINEKNPDASVEIIHVFTAPKRSNPNAS